MALSPNQSFYMSPDSNKPKRFVLAEFASAFSSYVALRSRQFSIFGAAAVEVLIGFGADVKAWAVQRMFWGRSSLYRSSFHLVVSVITITAVLSGLSARLNIISVAGAQGLDATSGIIGRQDVIQQSGTAETIYVASANTPDYPVYKHKVESGETLSEIAEKYQIKSSTIRWANSMTSDSIRVGQILRIPGIDGAFVKVKRGDTLESIANKTRAM
ncbi:MAG: Spore germination protein YaaH [candidate division WS6 bacterium OLB20]|uniref:Spore germination protein YaaH n=1 Tax=candidate division WS6 bacterium OLB20 TaxID=1617426 RepID=A0A136LYI5_9BACT|nr:MAG: Spore germination protein YaaH [candidate division WS6 bacterium OLB20]